MNKEKENEVLKDNIDTAINYILSVNEIDKDILISILLNDQGFIRVKG